MPEPSHSASTPRMESATLRAARMAERQWGVISREQLAGCGLSVAGIGRWVRAGRLHRMHPAVYALGHASVPIEGRLVAALLHAGTGAVLSHATAAWWWGLFKRPPVTLDVSAPGRAGSVEGLRVHHPRLVQRAHRRGFPLTPVSRTLRDIAPGLPLMELRRVVAEAEYLRLVDLEVVYRTLGRGRPGAAKLRRALNAHLPQLARTRSPLEVELLALCEEAGLRPPEVNVEVCGYEVDALWRDAGVIVEVDGADAHALRARMHADRERDLRLRAAGYTVLRYTWRQVTHERQAVATDIRRALDESAAGRAEPTRR